MKIATQAFLQDPTFVGDLPAQQTYLQTQINQQLCLQDPTCRASYIEGREASWLEQAIGTAFDIFAPGLSAIPVFGEIIPRGELLGPASGLINPLSLPPPETTAAVGVKALTVGLGSELLGGVPMNGFGDILGDIGSFFSGESTFFETLTDVGGDIWGGVSSLLPGLGTQALSTALRPLGVSSPARPVPVSRPGPVRPSIPELFLPEFLRPSQQEQRLPITTPGTREYDQWAIDTFGEPGTMGGSMAAGAVMLPAVRGMGTMALRATVNAMRSQGLAATVSWLAGVIRKFGPAAAVGFLASWVEDQIAQRAVFEAYGHKARRMNPANTKALRRSLRRLSSFDRLACRVQAQLYAGPARRGRRKRCGKCRQSPCRC